MKRSALVALLVAGVGFASISGAGPVYTWNGGVDTSWETAGNWGGLNGDMLIVFAADGPTSDLAELNGDNRDTITNATPFVQVNSGVTAQIKIRDGWWMRPFEANSTNEVLNVGAGATLSIDSVGNFYGNRGNKGEVATATIAGGVSVDNYMQLGNNFLMTIEGTGSLTTDGFLTTKFLNSIVSMEDGAAITFGTSKGDLLTVAQTEGYFGSTFLDLSGKGLKAVDNLDNTITITTIPEPATMGLVAAATAGILFIRRRFMI